MYYFEWQFERLLLQQRIQFKIKRNDLLSPQNNLALMSLSFYSTYQPQMFNPEIQIMPYFCYLHEARPFSEYPHFYNPMIQTQLYLAPAVKSEPIHEAAFATDSSFPSQMEDSRHDNSSPKCKKHIPKVNPASKFKYAKKNAESNVINQIFSFISIKGKSKQILQGVFAGNQQKIAVYYELMKQIKKKNKKYINRSYIKNLMAMESDHIIHSLLKKVENQCQLSVEEMRKAVRILVNHYMRSICVPTILTSVKLDKQTKCEHLQRRRDVFEFLQGHLKIWASE